MSKSFSCVWFVAIPWTIRSMEFPRPENWSGSLFPSLGDLPNPGIKPRSPTLQVDSLPADPQGKARIKKEETKNIINTGYDFRCKKFKIRIFTENSIVFPYIFFPYISHIFYNSNKKEPGLNLTKDEEDLYESESEVAQLCPTLGDPMDCSLPGFSVHGILQARILQWVAISFSRGSSQPRDRTWVSRIAGRCFNLWATREAPRSL